MISKPLAFRMRPEKLDEVLGQDKCKSFLNHLLENNALISMILYGPPGTGKTTIAECFARTFGVHFIRLNAVIDNKASMEQAFQEAIRFNPGIVIIDEIHRLDKGKQDLLLPHLENGDFFLIGCTTSNPLIHINPAIRSRTRLLETVPLSKKDILEGLKRALTSKNGLDSKRIFSPESLEYIASISGGDLRFAYNQLEYVSLSYSKDHLITLEDTKEIALYSNTFSDRDEDEHYNTVSALQKSIRGEDVDAAIYYLAKLIKSGDLEGLIRRLLVTAYEDVGLANPEAVNRCYHACQVAREVGIPECAIPLSFTVIDLALSPKSKSAALSIEKAMSMIDESPAQVRSYLKLNDAQAKEEDKYPYDRDDVWRHLVYLPEGFEKEVFYNGNTSGKYERALIARNEMLKKLLKGKTVKEAKKIADKLK